MLEVGDYKTCLHAVSLLVPTFQTATKKVPKLLNRSCKKNLEHRAAWEESICSIGMGSEDLKKVSWVCSTVNWAAALRHIAFHLQSRGIENNSALCLSIQVVQNVSGRMQHCSLLGRLFKWRQASWLQPVALSWSLRPSEKRQCTNCM